MFLLDTNALSETRLLALGRGDPSVRSWMQATDAQLFWVSVITLLEIERGILRVERRDTAQAAILRAWMETSVLTAFADRTFEVDTRIALAAARLHIPDPRPFADSLIAATAIVHGLTLITRNARDFAIPGLAVLNPWNG